MIEMRRLKNVIFIQFQVLCFKEKLLFNYISNLTFQFYNNILK